MRANRVESLEAPTTRPPARSPLRSVRVVYVLANEGYGGAEVHLRQLALGLGRKWFDPVVLLAEMEPMGILASELRDGGMAVHPLTTVTRRVDPRRSVELVRIIRAQRADIVHIHMPSPMGAESVFVAARLASVPVVISTEHTHAYHFRSVDGCAAAGSGQLRASGSGSRTV
jgi:Glycosyltransferase Family 4